MIYISYHNHANIFCDDELDDDEHNYSEEHSQSDLWKEPKLQEEKKIKVICKEGKQKAIYQN